MTEDAKLAPESTSAPTHRSDRCYRVSLVSFLIGLASAVIAVVAAVLGIKPGGFLLTADPLAAILSVVGFFLFVMSSLVSITAGIMALRYRRVVLWWVIPLLCCMGLVILEVFDLY